MQMTNNQDSPKQTINKRHSFQILILTASILVLIVVISFVTVFFYRSLEQGIYTERIAYLEEISEQIVSNINTISATQWDYATIFAYHMQQEYFSTLADLSVYLALEQISFSQDDLSLLAFDSKGNYYNDNGERARWQGTVASILSDSPQRQVEITTLPTTTAPTDEMVFIFRMETPVFIEEVGVRITHVAVVRDMSVFNTTLQVPSFAGQGESYIISRDGTRIFRGQAPRNLVIGNVYNVIKPLRDKTFLYGGSYQKLQQAVAAGMNCSFEFMNADGKRYYVTSSPMETNGWSLLSVIPSDVVSAQMQQFMRRTLVGIGAIAFVVVIAVTLVILMVVRYRSNRQLMIQQAQTNIALRDAAQAAREANQAKTVFLSHMSHDIRTPINGIMGMTDIATRNMDNPTMLKDCLGKITSASHHLLSLVNDVLDMSRIESGKIQIESAPFYIIALLDGCYSVIAGQALEKKIDLVQDFSGITQPMLKGDELHLRQIFINILGNAVKFTPEGGRIEFIASDKVIDGQSELTVVVSDNGIGMSEQFQRNIFEPFAQENEKDRGVYQGTGLGMSIVKQLLDLIGGDIELVSAPGKGSTFTVRLMLPIENVSQHEQVVTYDDSRLAGLSVLLVEDNELNMEISRYILEDCGMQVTAAVNGKEALDLFIQRPERSFDVILMDIMMPVMDGLEATRAIRSSDKGDAKSIPIVAMTANAYVEDRKAALEAGMNRHLAKPIERQDLIRLLHELGITRG